MSFDPIGHYFYSPGHCVRDAFRQALGEHPIVQELYDYITIDSLAYICKRHGFPVVRTEDGWERVDAHIGQKIIWIIAEHSKAAQGHAIFCADPRKIARAQERGEILVSGYILLED